MKRQARSTGIVPAWAEWPMGLAERISEPRLVVSCFRKRSPRGWIVLTISSRLDYSFVCRSLDFEDSFSDGSTNTNQNQEHARLLPPAS